MTTSPWVEQSPITQAADAVPHFATITLNTGATLNYWEQGATDGEVVILLHGYTDSWNTFALVLPHFSEDYHIFALDQRGHGNSSKAACCYTMENFTADVIAFMDAKGIAKATMVGHSMGSMVGQLVAIHHPDRVARLVLIGSMTLAANPGVREFNEVVQTLTDPVDPDFVRDFQMSTIYGNVPAPFIETVIAESLKPPAHVWRQAFDSFTEQDTTHELHKISAPTLILWGAQDAYFPRSNQETLARTIPNARLLVYEETGHNPHWEQTEQFIVDFEQFMQATSEVTPQ